MMGSSGTVVAPVSEQRIYTKQAGLVALMSFVMVLGVVAPSSATNIRHGSTKGGTPEFEEPQSVGATSGPSITIVEDAVPNAAQDFSFTGCQRASCSPFALDDDTDPALPNTVSASGLTAGVYTIAQGPGVSHWVLDDIFCDTGEDVDIENRTVTISLGEGDEVVCTFTNRSPSIRIIEEAIPDAPQDFAFIGCQGGGCGSFLLDDDADPALSNSVTASGLAPGTYTIGQAETAGWALADLSCNTGETIDLDHRTVTVTVGTSEFARCTFTNRSNGIRIVQNTEPDDPIDFGYTSCLDSTCAHFDLDDDDEPTLANSVSGAGLTPGVYTVTQDEVPGYELFDLTCDRYSEVDLVERRFTVFMDGYGIVNCTFSNRPTLTPLTEVAQISAGSHHTCVRLTNGQARCWGQNTYGQLGDGTTTDRSQAVVVVNPEGTGPLTDVAEISAGSDHTCVRLTNGQARCWGQNTYGQLGDGTTTDRDQAVSVSNSEGTGPLADVAEISAGGLHTCTRRANGQARCWGRNSYGQLGDGTITDRLRPVAVSNTTGTGALTDVAEISAGGLHTCAPLTNGQARCWGRNSNGQLGDGATTGRRRPVTVLNTTGTGPIVGVGEIAASRDHTCARLTRQVRCWGNNAWGKLGDGTLVDSTLPVAVVDPLGDGPLTQVVELTAGQIHACARIANGEARCWGYGRNGQLGGGNNSTTNSRPVVVSNSEGTGPFTDATQIDAGYDHTCAALANGEARCWGDNSYGQLGDGSLNGRPRPVQVFTF